MKKVREHGKNIRAPRSFEEGEFVLFIQRIYGLSMCFGQGYIYEVCNLTAGPLNAPVKARQYRIKGTRVFYHQGGVHEERGTFNTWLGGEQIVIVPRTAKSTSWFKSLLKEWRTFLDTHADIMGRMRFK